MAATIRAVLLEPARTRVEAWELKRYFVPIRRRIKKKEKEKKSYAFFCLAFNVRRLLMLRAVPRVLLYVACLCAGYGAGGHHPHLFPGFAAPPIYGHAHVQVRREPGAERGVYSRHAWP